MNSAQSRRNWIVVRFASLSGIVTVLALMLMVALPQTGFGSTKKMTVNVTVLGDESCPFGISLVHEGWGGQLCAPNYPAGAAGLMSGYFNQTIQVEAAFLYSGNPKTAPPNAILRMIKIAGAKVYDPCSFGSALGWGLAGMGGSLPPGCQESLDASVPSPDTISINGRISNALARAQWSRWGWCSAQSRRDGRIFYSDMFYAATWTTQALSSAFQHDTEQSYSVSTATPVCLIWSSPDYKEPNAKARAELMDNEKTSRVLSEKVVETGWGPSLQ